MTENTLRNNSQHTKRTLPRARKQWGPAGGLKRPTRAPRSLFNLFTHTFSDLRRPRAMADPSTAAARLQVLGMSCDLTGSLPATRLHSDRSGFDRLDCTGTECCLTDDAPHALLEATKFNAGFTCMRVYHDPPSWSRPMRVCLRSEAPWHAAEEASSPCVPPATMRLLGIAHLARDRLPRPEASTRPSSLRPGG